MTYRTDWSNSGGVIIGYMDKVDFDHEVGCASGGNRVYPTIDALVKAKKCVPSCGIVEVEVRLKRVILESDFDATKEETEARLQRLLKENFQKAP